MKEKLCDSVWDGFVASYQSSECIDSYTHSVHRQEESFNHAGQATKDIVPS